MTPYPSALEGAIVRLEPMTFDHVDGLVAAATEDRATFGFTHVPGDRVQMQAYVAEALNTRDAGRAVPFTVWDRRSGRIAGTTRYLDLEAFTWPPPWPVGVNLGPSLADGVAPSVAEIGSTWYAPSLQGTGLNLEAKLLLLGQAFESWRVLRVTLKTDARNVRSRRAIEKLGAAFEGVRRAHAPAIGGGVRDTAYYSVLDIEWPAVRRQIVDHLGAGGSGGGRV